MPREMRRKTFPRMLLSGKLRWARTYNGFTGEDLMHASFCQSGVASLQLFHRDHGSCYCLCPVAKDPRAGEQWHQMCRVGAGWTAVPADGQLWGAAAPQLRHVQPLQLCSCRHVAAYPRHSPASETRVCLLGRRSAHSERFGSSCAPVAQAQAVRQLCQCCCIVETMLATAVATTLRPPGFGGYFLVLLEIVRWGQGRLRGTLGCVS